MYQHATVPPVPAERWDAVVVGARCAGAATAMLLARRGWRVLLLERARYGSDTLSTHALMRAGTVQLHRWGLLAAVADAGTPPVRRTTFHYGDEPVAVSIRPALGVDALYAPRRYVLDSILVDAARRAGAEVRFGTAVTGITRAGDGRVTGALTRERTGRVSAVRATLVVGADGRNSTIAAAVESPVVRAGTAASAFLFGYWSDLPTSGYEWFYHPAASAGMIPTNGGQTCVFAGTASDRLVVDGPPSFGQLLASASPAAAQRVAGARAVSTIRIFRGAPGFLRRAWGPGWALVGDAGQWKDPLSTYGMSDALRDAELLATAVDGALGNRTLDGALAGYEHERDRLSARMFPVVEALASYRWDLDGVRRLLLELSSAMTEQVEALATPDLTPAAATR